MMPEWIELVMMGVGMESARFGGAADRLAHFCAQAEASLDDELKELRAKMERMRRPARGSQ